MATDLEKEPRMQSKGIAARAGHWSATHRKTAIGGWIAFVVVGLGAGSIGQKELSEAESYAGESRAAELALEADGPRTHAVEQVLIETPGPTPRGERFEADVERIRNQFEADVAVRRVEPTVVTADGRAALLSVEVKGWAEDADQILFAIETVREANPDLEIGVAGSVTAEAEIEEAFEDDFARAETLSIPITLAILVIAFGALVAAGIPVLLAVSAVAAAIGLTSLTSQLFPVDDAISSVILLIGMAVGVDYSLFYVQREREERRRGATPAEALAVAAATSGRAVLISGLTVIAAMAGMFLSGSDEFISFGVGTLVVVAVAMLGSLTVLPALLSLLGDRVERGRIPFLSRLRRSDRDSRIWSAVIPAVMRRPVASLLVAGGALVALTIPAFGMQTKVTGVDDLPAGFATIETLERIGELFPWENPPAVLVVQAADVRSPEIRGATEELTASVAARGISTGPPETEVNYDGDLAVVSLPLVEDGDDEESELALATLRGELIPAAYGGTGATVDVTGATASNVDYGELLGERLPLVFAFVLGLAFLLLLVTFRSVVIPLSSIALNLLSVGAAYGVLVLIFQVGIGRSLLGAEESAITSWLPMFMFVVLFGLSMDYHVFIVSRIRELVDSGVPTQEAVATGIRSTAGTVTSAALVMVAVFSIFATLSFVDMKQLGVGLAAAILIDATIVRGILLPALMKLLGDRNWYLPRWLEWLPRAGGESSAVGRTPISRREVATKTGVV